MNSVIKDNYFIMTGGMGVGKTSTLSELKNLNFLCVEEPARDIIAEQKFIGGTGIYDRNPKLFIELMLSRCMFQFTRNLQHKDTIIFDRGIPDMMEYANFAKLDLNHLKGASVKFRYNTKVFFFPSWKEIYQNDEERIIKFEQSKKFGDDVKEIYIDLGYEIIEVPLAIAFERAKFISKVIAQQNKI